LFSILSQKLLLKKVYEKNKNIPGFSFPDFTYRIFSVYFYTVQYRISINVPFFGAGRNDFDVGKLITRAIRNRDFFGP
jgi:hypothetical protein